MKSENFRTYYNRLSVYLRCLNTLAAAGIKTSRPALAEQFKSQLGANPKIGLLWRVWRARVGYYVADLREHITKILGWINASRWHCRRRAIGYALRTIALFEIKFTVVAC